MAEPTRPCPGKCGADVPRSKLTCKPCWYRLPRPLRDEITGAYRARWTDGLRHARAISEASRWYRANPLTEG